MPTGAAAANRYNVNLPVANPAGTHRARHPRLQLHRRPGAVGRAGRDRGEVISSPRVITANQKEATIEQGVEIPYQQSASSGATTIQFKKAVLSLKVTPQITPDNRIILDLDVKEDSVGQVVVASGGVNVPSIDTREITTQVLVNDGQTVVLGGILETDAARRRHQGAVLGDIPVLGHLFKSTDHEQQQGRAADLHDAEDRARGRQRLLIDERSCWQD